MWESEYSVEASVAPESVWPGLGGYLRTEITGAGADELGPHLGPGNTAAFPDAVAKLVELAQLRGSGS